ncbi:hypothetical protein ACWCWD_34080 [Streptomyces sp. NPDC001493]
MASGEGLTGSSRVTVFALFGVVVGYATHHLDTRLIGDVAVLGPLTPGTEWRHLWRMARNCGRPTADEKELAQWLLTQATRALVCGSDRIAQFPERGWKLEPGGMCVRFDAPYANRDQLWTGNLTVEGLAPEQVAERPTLYTA